MVIVAGLAVAAVHDAADALLGRHTAVVHHDLAELVRRIRRTPESGDWAPAGGQDRRVHDEVARFVQHVAGV